MALYMIGDIQGCDFELSQLLQHINFSPSRDTLFALGDLVNRGPHSLAVLRRLQALGSSAQCLLGNHDLHLLAIGLTGATHKRLDTLQDILNAPDRADLLDWLRKKPLAIHQHGWLMVHAGVLAQWTLAETLHMAAIASATIGHDDPQVYQHFFKHMYGNMPNSWASGLNASPLAQMRLSVNALTRIRLCDTQGLMDFEHKGSAQLAPAGLMPWFEVPGRATVDVRIGFGHWSTLQLTQATQVPLGGVLPLDGGCLWGGCLQAAEFSPGSPDVLLHRVACQGAQLPSE